jgi:hypothetical protein
MEFSNFREHLNYSESGEQLKQQFPVAAKKISVSTCAGLSSIVADSLVPSASTTTPFASVASLASSRNFVRISATLHRNVTTSLSRGLAESEFVKISSTFPRWIT